MLAAKVGFFLNKSANLGFFFCILLKKKLVSVEKHHVSPSHLYVLQIKVYCVKVKQRIGTPYISYEKFEVKAFFAKSETEGPEKMPKVGVVIKMCQNFSWVEVRNKSVGRQFTRIKK